MTTSYELSLKLKELGAVQDFGSDTVKGYATPAEVAEWIFKIQKVQNISQL